MKCHYYLVRFPASLASKSKWVLGNLSRYYPSLYPGTQMPTWLDSYSGSDLAEKVEKRIDDALSHFNGSLTGWDVNNEMTHGEVLLANTNDPDIR